MIILGLSGGLGHDAAACIVKDGVLISYAEEERFIRKRFAYNEAPICSVLYCLQEAQITMQDVDAIALSWDPEVAKYWTIVEKFKYHALFANQKLPPIIPVNHHLSHAASGYYISGFDEATILVIDGQGEGASTTIAHGKDGQIHILRSYGVEQSLGYFYDYVTNFLNLGRSGAGKLMGLAAYGKPRYKFPIELTENGYHINVPPLNADVPFEREYAELRKLWLYRLYRLFGEARTPDYKYDYITGKLGSTMKYTEQDHDIAASAQAVLEEVILHLVQRAIAETGSRNVVIAGGVGLNCTVNGMLERSSYVDHLYIPPSANDAGGCLGAAYYVSQTMGVKSPVKSLENVYWGSQFSNEQIEQVLKHLGVKATYVEDVAAKGAEMLLENKVFGWYQGRSEMGPRALGNRSIVANPCIFENLDRINNEVKYRELWRPLAPSVLNEKADWLLEDASYSPFMLKAYTVKEAVREKVPAITHVDATTRPQTVTAENNKLWYDLIHNFYQATGVPLVLNTSLNTKAEPICESPVDAIKTLYSCGMNALFLGNYLIEK